MHPEPVALRPAPAGMHSEPVAMRPEPVAMRPEPVEGHMRESAMPAGRKTSRSWRNVMTRATSFLPLDTQRAGRRQVSPTEQ
jgi:hypothetical protein